MATWMCPEEVSYQHPPQDLSAPGAALQEIYNPLRRTNNTPGQRHFSLLLPASSTPHQVLCKCSSP